MEPKPPSSSSVRTENTHGRPIEEPHSRCYGKLCRYCRSSSDSGTWIITDRFICRLCYGSDCGV